MPQTPNRQEREQRYNTEKDIVKWSDQLNKLIIQSR